MTAAIPLQQGVEPSLHSLVDQGNTSCVNDYEMPKNDTNFMEMDDVCDYTTADINNVNPTTFVTGPETWPEHLQLKVKTGVISSSLLL